MPARRPTAYGRFARVYDWLAVLWSGGAIRRARRWTVEGVERGTTVIVVGAGTGDAAVRAAIDGASVRAVDTSSAMLDRVADRASRAGVTVDPVRCDLRTNDALSPGGWQRIAAPFILSCISSDEVAQVMQRLAASLGPGGRLRIADFGVPAGRGLTRAAFGLYYAGPSLLFGMFARNPVQRPHDFSALAAAAGLVVVHRCRFGVYRVGPRWFEGIELERAIR